MSLYLSDDTLSPPQRNYYIPMADLFAGVVFILVILLMAVAFTSREDFTRNEQVMQEAKRLEKRLAELQAFERTSIAPRERAREALVLLLGRIAADLTKAGVTAISDERGGRVLFSSRDLFEASDEVSLSAEGRRVIDVLAASLRRHLPCISRAVPAKADSACADMPPAQLNRFVVAAFSDAASGAEAGELSTALGVTSAQAAVVYGELVRSFPGLVALRDGSGASELEFWGGGNRSAGLEAGQPLGEETRRFELLFRIEPPPSPGPVWTQLPR